MNGSERWLAFLLRLGGVLTGSALVAVFLPESTMASIHRWLGLGELAPGPMTNYLTRSLSAMYAFHGGLLLVLSTDVRRFRRVIVFVGWATFALGLVLLGVDLHAGLPSWWVWSEGPWAAGIGIVLVRLAAGVRRESG